MVLAEENLKFKRRLKSRIYGRRIDCNDSVCWSRMLSMSMMRLGKLENLTGADMITLSRVPVIFPSSYESMEIRKVSAPGGAICGCRIMLPFPRMHNDTA